MLTPREHERYSRQIGLLGVDGQDKLKQAKVFIAGAGGLGCPISIYLAAAGIGKISIVDKDVVSLSNLNRQILHWEKDVDRKKASSAKEKLREINHDIDVHAESVTITKENASELVEDADLIIDAMDNYTTRYLLNKTAIEKDIPFIHGAINGFHGQAMTVVPRKSACLRCVFRQAPPETAFPVIGTTPGIIGLIQATEAIKCIAGIGDLLEGKLLLWDGLNCQTDVVQVERDPLCQDCRTAGLKR
jgi:molybdopterin/thiamine biosynthesis adenylyltransferase